MSQELYLEITSDEKLGAKNKTALGSRFTVSYNPPIVIPRDARNVHLEVENATIWWVVPNIITGVNDKFYITGQNVSNVLTNFVVTIPKGLYDLTQLNNAIQEELGNQGARVNPSPLISFATDLSTNRVEIIFNYDDVSIDFNQPQSLYEILGFDQLTYGPYPIVPQVIDGPNVPLFNQVNHFLLHSNLITEGLRVNNNYSQTIAKVLIDKRPGSQIIYNPNHPIRINAENLRGSSVSQATYWLTDDSNREVDTNGENFTMLMSIKYDL